MKTLALIAALCLPLSAAELPADAAALKAKRDAKLAEINLLYSRELEKLQNLALKNGNLAGANAIEAEIAAATPDPFQPALDGKWDYRMAGNLDAKTRRFKGSEMIDEGGTARAIKRDGNVMTIVWGEGVFEKITIDPAQPNILRGTNHAGQSFTYRRVTSIMAAR